MYVGFLFLNTACFSIDIDLIGSCIYDIRDDCVLTFYVYGSQGITTTICLVT